MENNGIEAFLTFIRSRSRHHQEIFQAEVSEFIKETEKIYLDEVDIFISSYKNNPDLEMVLRPFYIKISEYLKWLRWVYWNIANLGPILFKERQAAARQLALASMAYASGRFIDDGFDNHENFKGLQRTLVGFLRDNLPGRPLHEGCVQSVYVGFHLFQHVIMRFRDLNLNNSADELSKLFNIASIGLLAECHTGYKIEPNVYFQIIRRKAVAYNMILYKPFLKETDSALRDKLLVLLAEMDELAQILNDLGDKEEDMLKGKMNISSHLENSSAIVNGEIISRVQKLMDMLTPLPEYVQNAFAAMLINLKWEANFKNSQPQTPFVATLRKGSRKSITDTSCTRAIQEAIDNGLKYLGASQGDTGEFATYWSENIDMSSSYQISSPFITGMILLAIQNINGKNTRTIKDKGLAYLKKCRKANGFFSFLETGINDDLDDTCLLNFLLQQQEEMPGYYTQLAEQIGHLPHPNGLYFTWLQNDKKKPNDIDPCVNLNIVRFLSFNGIDCSLTIKELRSFFEYNTVFEGTLYYQPGWTFLYFFSSLPIELKRKLVTDKQLANILTYPIASNSINLAMRIYCLASVGTVSTNILSLIIQLLELQDGTGKWPNCSIFRAFNYWGSPDLTTAICIQALQEYNDRQGFFDN